MTINNNIPVRSPQEDVGNWRKGIAQWQVNGTLYLSVPFTWLLPKAHALAVAHQGPVQAGGPAVQLMPDYLAKVATVNQPCPEEPLVRHNYLATFTTRGCPNQCGFCAVPKLEGDFRELAAWRLAPIICDNNLLAASRRHFDGVIDRLRALPWVDFNQGLEARLLRPSHVRRLAELRRVKIRFAFDHIDDEAAVADAIKLCREHGLKDFGVYVLIGFDDTPDDALYRLEKVWGWKAAPFPMRYQPLDALAKNQYVAPGWSHRKLQDIMRCYSRSVFTGHIHLDDYNPRQPSDLPSLFD